MPQRIARIVQTCHGRPSEWDAWTTDGQYLYLRYRHGIGSVEAQPGPDVDTWHDNTPLTEWNDGTGCGDITLNDFLVAAGLELAPDADVT